jgi:hypothetical protein
MEHSIVIFKKLKKRNKEGKYNYHIASRYTLKEAELLEQEMAKFNEDIEKDDEYEYFAEIEQTLIN